MIRVGLLSWKSEEGSLERWRPAPFFLRKTVQKMMLYPTTDIPPFVTYDKENAEMWWVENSASGSLYLPTNNQTSVPVKFETLLEGMYKQNTSPTTLAEIATLFSAPTGDYQYDSAIKKFLGSNTVDHLFVGFDWSKWDFYQSDGSRDFQSTGEEVVTISILTGVHEIVVDEWLRVKAREKGLPETLETMMDNVESWVGFYAFYKEVCDNLSGEFVGFLKMIIAILAWSKQQSTITNILKMSGRNNMFTDPEYTGARAKMIRLYGEKIVEAGYGDILEMWTIE